MFSIQEEDREIVVVRREGARNVPNSTRGQVSANSKFQVIQSLLKKAKTSRFGLWLLNTALRLAVPFNRPHGITVKSLADDRIEVSLPYKKKNLNHIRGIHACALATASEFATGVLLMGIFDPSRYRIIMSSIQVAYHYQAKKDVVATCSLPKDRIEDGLLKPLREQGTASFPITAEIHDTDGRHISTATMQWHFKDWQEVRTK